MKRSSRSKSWAWEEPKAPALRGLADGIRGQVNDRKYAQASKTVDQLLPKLKPLYDEHVKQKEAKEKYDAALEALQPRLTKASTSEHAKLKPKQDEMAALQKEMEASAQSKNYVQALKQVGDLASKVEAYEQALEELEKQKKAYEDAWTALQPKLTQAEQSQFKKLEPKQQELATAKPPIEASAQKEEYEQALKQVNDFSTKVDAYLAAVEELQKQKKAYEDAWAALQPRFEQTSQAQFKKLVPLQEELTKIKEQIDAAVQAEDYEQALKLVNDLSTKVDAYLAAVEEAEKQKKAYEDAWAALEPKFKEALQSQSAKLAPKRDELTAAKGQIETTAQSEDYEQALTQVNDLSTKVDAYLAAVEELQKQKKAYEDAWAALQPRFEQTSQAQFKKLVPLQEEFPKIKGQIDAAVQAEDYEQALKLVNDLSTKVDAYLAAVEEAEKQKKAYEDALAAVQPKLDEAGQSTFAKLAPKRDELTAAKGQVEATAQSEEYEQALKQVNDLSTKVDAYLAAVEELQKQKKAYEDAWAALQPRFEQTSQSQFKKLAPKQEELTKIKGEIDAAVQAEDDEQALKLVTDLSTKVDEYLAAVEEAEKQKKAYEDALAALQPKLSEAEQSTFAKLAPMRDELTAAKGQIEPTAQSEDYEQALKQVNDVSTKVDAYLAAVEELQKQKKAYEDAWAALQPRFDQTSQSQFKKLAPLQEELTKIKGQIDAAVQAEDYEQALKLVNDLSTKVDAYLAAVEEAEKQRKAYEDAWTAVGPKFTEAMQSQSTKLAPKRDELTALKEQIDKAVEAEDYEQALKLTNDLGTKVDAYLEAVKALEEQKQKYEEALHALQPELDEVAKSTSKSQAPMRDEIAKIKGEMEKAATAEEYEQALKHVEDLKSKVKTYKDELNKAREEYTQELERVETGIKDVDASKFAQLGAKKAEIMSGYEAMKKLAEAEDYKAAVEAGRKLEVSISDYLAEVKKLRESIKANIKAHLPQIEADMKELDDEKSPKKKQIDTLLASVKAAAGGDDDAALEKAAKELEELSRLVDQLKNDPCAKARRSPEYKLALADQDIAEKEEVAAAIAYRNAKKMAPVGGAGAQPDPVKRAQADWDVDKAKAAHDVALAKEDKAVQVRIAILKKYGCNETAK